MNSTFDLNMLPEPPVKKVFEITGHGHVGGDECSSYHISLVAEGTVLEAAVQIISNENEWGTIECIPESDPRNRSCYLEYKHGHVVEGRQVSAEILASKVVKIAGSGGWSRSDFNIYYK